MATTIVHGARVVGEIGPGRVVDLPDGWIAFADGRIAAHGEGSGRSEHAWRGEHTRQGEQVDARVIAGPGALLVPGFVDIHTHGGAGASFDEIARPDGEARALEAIAMHASHGTTRLVMSLVAAPVNDLVVSLRAIRDLASQNDAVLGAHLEGPFLAPERRGAHVEAHLRAPDPVSVEALLDAAPGVLRQITIAPELDGALDAIRRFAERGVAVAVGHTDADMSTVAGAFTAGATILTHAFNAMRPLGHRDPGPLGAATSDPNVVLELIADGVHVHPEPLRILAAAAPHRIALITDAMAATGHADGDYRLGDAHVTVVDGVARLDAGTIAGSTLTQDRALATALAASIDVQVAVPALTAIPARAVGRTDLGSFADGALADAVLLDDELAVRAVWRGGTRIV